MQIAFHMIKISYRSVTVHMVQTSMVQHNLKLSQQQPPEATVIKSVTYKPQYLYIELRTRWPWLARFIMHHVENGQCVPIPIKPYALDNPNQRLKSGGHAIPSHDNKQQEGGESGA